MQVKDLISTMKLDQKIIIFNQFNAETYDGLMRDLDENEFAEQIKKATVRKHYTFNKIPNYIVIDTTEEE